MHLKYLFALVRKSKVKGTPIELDSYISELGKKNYNNYKPNEFFYEPPETQT